MSKNKLQSKTARASSVKGSKMTDANKVAEAAKAHSPRIVPLANGAMCYFYNPITGRMPKVRTNDDFVTEVLPSCELGLTERLRDELIALDEANPSHGWKLVLARLDKALEPAVVAEDDVISEDSALVAA